MNTATQDPTKLQDAPAAGAGAQAPTLVERMPRPERIVVESEIPVLDTAKFDHMMRIAKLMATSGLVPEHLNTCRKIGRDVVALSPEEAVANCFLVTNQAVRWKMDPFAVAQHTFVTKGKIGYEGKLVAAVINTHPFITKRLKYTFTGDKGKPNRGVTVTARTAADDEDREIEGTVAGWQTENENWKKQPDQQLCYRGAREWARRWFPEAILGVWGDDELETFNATDARMPGDQQPQQQQRGAAGLARALASGATDATDATIVPDVARDAGALDTTGAGVADQKPEGTVAQRDQLVADFKACNDLEILALKHGKVGDFTWTQPDLDVIELAYAARRSELQQA